MYEYLSGDSRTTEKSDACVPTILCGGIALSPFFYSSIFLFCIVYFTFTVSIKEPFQLATQKGRHFFAFSGLIFFLCVFFFGGTYFCPFRLSTERLEFILPNFFLFFFCQEVSSSQAKVVSGRVVQ